MIVRSFRRYVEPTPEYGLPAGVAAEISIPIRYAAPAHPAAYDPAWSIAGAPLCFF